MMFGRWIFVLLIASIFLVFAQVGADYAKRHVDFENMTMVYQNLTCDRYCINETRVVNVSAPLWDRVMARGVNSVMMGANALIYTGIEGAKTSMEYGYQNPDRHYDGAVEFLYWVTIAWVVSICFIPALYILLALYFIGKWLYVKHQLRGV